VRVTVVNPSPDASWAVVAFYTAAGQPVKREELTVDPRQTAVLDLTGDNLCGVTGRTQVWAAVRYRDPGLCPGLEVIDTATRKTTLRYSSPHDISKGKERWVFPSVGVTSDQVARAAVINPSAIVCRSVVVFLDAAGQRVKRIELELQPRQIGWVDLTRGELAEAAGRVQVRAEVFAGQRDQQPGVEVFETATGPALVACDPDPDAPGPG
jgi:hypothetical protein